MSADNFTVALHEVLGQARKHGYCVVIFDPEELRGIDPRRIEDVCIERGNEAIEQLAGPDVSELDDVDLTAEELTERYQVEHPTHTIAEWQDETAAHGLTIGYWDWVSEQLAADPK